MGFNYGNMESKPVRVLSKLIFPMDELIEKTNDRTGSKKYRNRTEFVSVAVQQLIDKEKDRTPMRSEETIDYLIYNMLEQQKVKWNQNRNERIKTLQWVLKRRDGI